MDKTRRNNDRKLPEIVNNSSLGRQLQISKLSFRKQRMARRVKISRHNLAPDIRCTYRISGCLIQLRVLLQRFRRADTS